MKSNGAKATKKKEKKRSLNSPFFLCSSSLFLFCFGSFGIRAFSLRRGAAQWNCVNSQCEAVCTIAFYVRWTHMCAPKHIHLCIRWEFSVRLSLSLCVLTCTLHTVPPTKHVLLVRIQTVVRINRQHIFIWIWYVFRSDERERVWERVRQRRRCLRQSVVCHDALCTHFPNRFSVWTIW